MIHPNDQFGDWIVVKVNTRLYKSPCGQSKWMSQVRCICGREKEVFNMNLTQRKSKSCGLDHKIHIDYNRATDKRGRTPEFLSWSAMMQRCYRPNSVRYHSYGAKGIRVCKKWHKFENFLADMGERPKGKTLDRINGLKGYFPKNCKWSTCKEQANNKINRRIKN
jgi:hypothetical protein